MAADNEIKVLLTADLSDLKAGMDAAAESVAGSSEAMTAAVVASSTEIQAAQVAVAESAEAAALRIKAMVTASLEAARSNAGLGESERSLAERMGLRVEATDAQLDATAAQIAAQNDQMASAARQAAVETEVAEATSAATVAVEANTEAIVVNAGVTREAGVLAGEALRGNWTRLEGSAMVMANRLNLLQYAFSPLGLAITAAAAAVGTFAYEAYEGIKADDDLAHSLTLTSGVAGMTRDQLLSLSSATASAEVSAREAEQAVTKLAGSGRFNAEQMQLATQAAADMATVTGQSMDQAVDAVMKLQANPVEAVRALDQQFHFLSLTQMEEIEQLEKTGDATDAATTALNAFADAMANRAPEAVKETNLIKQAWQDLGMVIDGIGTRMGDSLREASVDEKIAKINAQIQTLRDGQGVDSGSDILDAIFAQDTSGQIADLEQQRAALEKTKQAAEDAAKAKAKAAQVQTDGINAAKAFDSQFASLDRKNERLQKSIELEQQLKAIHDANPNDERVQGVEFDPLSGAAVGGAKLAELLAEINKKYQDIDTTTRAQHQAEAQAARERKQAMAEELNDLEMVRAGTAANTAERMQADASVLTNASRLYGENSSQQKAALNQLLADEKSYDAAVVREREQAARQQEVIDIDAAQTAASTKRQQIETAFELGNISRQQELTAIAAANEAEYQLEMQAFARELALLDAKSKAAEEVERKIANLQKQYTADAAKSDADRQKAMQQSWQKALKPIDSAFQQSIQGMIQGTQSFKKGLDNILLSIVASYAQMGISMLMNWIANEGAKSEATATGVAQRNTQEAAGAVQSKTIDAATGKSQIGTAAATGAAKAYQAIVGIPYVGPILAPIAAGVAFAGIEAFSASIASARGGWDRVPFDGAMTELHKDEMVLPKPLADGVRQMTKSGQGGAPQVHLHTTDPRSFKDYLRRNPGAIASAVKLAGRRGHMLGAR